MSYKDRTNSIITIALLAALLGLLGGIFGHLIAGEYLFQNWYGFPLSGSLSLNRTGLNNSDLVIKGAKNITVEQDKKVKETIDSASDSIVGVFRQKQDLVKEEGDMGELRLENYYNLGEHVSQGLIITSDGWVVASDFGGALSKKNIQDRYAVITSERKLYEIEDIKRAPDTSFLFLRLKGAKGLPVKDMAAEKETTAGDQVVISDWDKKGLLTSVVEKRSSAEGMVRSSEVFEKVLRVADDIPTNFNTGFVFNLKGGVVGLYNGDQIDSINNFQSNIRSLLKDKDPQIPFLGVNYVQLSEVLISSDKYKQGALIYPDAGGVAVKKDSPADKNGLQRGDIIISVDNKKINENTSLSYLIQKHNVGEEVTISYIRDGETQTISLKLGSK